MNDQLDSIFSETSISEGEPVKLNLPTLTIPQLQELITNAVKAALAGLIPPQAPSAEEKKFLSRKELCKQLGITYPTLDRLVKSGVLPTYRVGQRRIVFKKEDVEKYLQNNREY